MAFPILSTAYGTAATKRIERVLQRSNVGSGSTRIISSASRFACRKISGSDSWSQHAYGNADDIFPTAGDTQAKLRHIADAVVTQATTRTVANRGRKLDVAEVIDHDAGRIWTPSEGWHAYGGATGAHIHVSGKPLRSGTPACAS